MLNGLHLENYKYDIKQTPTFKSFQHIHILNEHLSSEDGKLKLIQTMAQKRNLCRTLSNTRPNIATPVYFLEQAQLFVKQNKNVELVFLKGELF